MCTLLTLLCALRTTRTFLSSSGIRPRAVDRIVTNNSCAADERTRKLIHRKYWNSLLPADDTIIVRNTRSTGLTFLALFFVKPAADIRAATWHDTAYVWAGRQFVLEERKS